MPTMNFRRISKAVAAALLAVGLITAGVAPATAATTRHAPSSQTDTGWGFK
jgi:Spy/CpxP family protein refolding chaperone